MVQLDVGIIACALAAAGLMGLAVGSFVCRRAWRYAQGGQVAIGSGTAPRRFASAAACAAVFVGVVAVYGLSLQALELLAFSGILLFLSLTDLQDYLIPNKCIVAAIAVRVAYWAAAWWFAQVGIPAAAGGAPLGALATAPEVVSASSVAYYVASGLAIGLVMLALVLVADKVFGRDSMGGGDLKLFAVAGMYFGWWQGLLLVMLSCVIGVATALLASTGAGSADGPSSEGGRENVLHRAIPFGPSIAAACVITMVAGSLFSTW